MDNNNNNNNQENRLPALYQDGLRNVVLGIFFADETSKNDTNKHGNFTLDCIVYKESREGILYFDVSFEKVPDGIGGRLVFSLKAFKAWLVQKTRKRDCMIELRVGSYTIMSVDMDSVCRENTDRYSRSREDADRNRYTQTNRNTEKLDDIVDAFAGSSFVPDDENQQQQRKE